MQNGKQIADGLREAAQSLEEAANAIDDVTYADDSEEGVAEDRAEALQEAGGAVVVAISQALGAFGPLKDAGAPLVDMAFDAVSEEALAKIVANAVLANERLKRDLTFVEETITRVRAGAAT